MLQFFIQFLRFDSPLLHFFQSCSQKFDLAVILDALLWELTFVLQTDWTRSKKPGCSTQKFSNLKIWALRIEVPI
jgi:hypothetical protein